MGAKLKCLNCGDIIESKHRHDFQWCSCRSIFIDGGNDYCRIGGNLSDMEFVEEDEEEENEDEE